MKGVIFMSTDTQSRKWLITINNPIRHGYNHNKIKNIMNETPSTIYWCMADEVGAKNETPHTHIYIHLKNPIRFSTLQKKFPSANLKMVNKSSKVNKNYLKKGGQWEDTDKAHTVVEGTFEEFGEIPDDKIDVYERPSNQKHYGALYQYIADGLTDGEILALNPNYIPMIGKFQAIRNAINEKTFSYEHRNLEVYYIYGASRWKKVENIRKKYGDTNIYSVSDYDNPFDDYDSEDIIILEEYDSSFPILTLCHYLQPYPIKVGNKYNRKTACYTKVYIVSKHPLYKQHTADQNTFDGYKHLFLDKITGATFCQADNTEIEHDANFYYAEDEDGLPFEDVPPVQLD